jgi:hypothetical protein
MKDITMCPDLSLKRKAYHKKMQELDTMKIDYAKKDLHWYIKVGLIFLSVSIILRVIILLVFK